MHRSTQPNQNQEIRTLCSHVFPATDAVPTHPCGSPALRGQSFPLPPPTTRDELQRSLSQLITLIAADRIDLRRAGLLLAALQTAGQHLRQ